MEKSEVLCGQGEKRRWPIPPGFQEEQVLPSPNKIPLRLTGFQCSRFVVYLYCYKTRESPYMPIRKAVHRTHLVCDREADTQEGEAVHPEFPSAQVSGPRAS